MVVGASPEPMVRLRERIVIARDFDRGSRLARGASPSTTTARCEGELSLRTPRKVAEHINALVDPAPTIVQGLVVRFGTEKAVDRAHGTTPGALKQPHFTLPTASVAGKSARARMTSKGLIDVLAPPRWPDRFVGAFQGARHGEIDDLFEPTWAVLRLRAGPWADSTASGNVDTAIARYPHPWSPRPTDGPVSRPVRGSWPEQRPRTRGLRSAMAARKRRVAAVTAAQRAALSSCFQRDRRATPRQEN